MPKLTNKLTDSITVMDMLFDKAVDYTKLNLQIAGASAVLLSLEGQINKDYTSIGVLNPIMSSVVPKDETNNIMKFVKTEVLAAVDQADIYDTDDIAQKMMLGFAVLVIDGYDFAVGFSVQGFKLRGIAEPNNETMLRGSKEGFIESVQINMSLIRKRMKSTNLKFERMYVGKESNTPILLCYLENRVSKKILGRIKLEIENIDLETVMAAGYIRGYLKNNKGGFFNNVGLTERPDTVCGKIEEGRVAIIVDGTPSVLIVPHLFSENFQTMDDYANKAIYATVTRVIKYIAFLISTLLPALYLAVVTHRPELVHDALLLKIAQAEATTPFNIFWELLLVNLLYEIMREAGLRAPKVLSQSVSIVGALVVGDMAVSAGLIGAPSIIIIAAAAISDYAVPKLYEQTSLLRLILLVIGGVLGPWGVVVSVMFLLFNLCGQESFGVPITAPITPFSKTVFRDVIFRMPWKVIGKNRNKVQNMPGMEGET